MDMRYLTRNVNEGFSGGEKKRNEILQARCRLRPRLRTRLRESSPNAHKHTHARAHTRRR